MTRRQRTQKSPTPEVSYKYIDWVWWRLVTLENEFRETGPWLYPLDLLRPITSNGCFFDLLRALRFAKRKRFDPSDILREQAISIRKMLTEGNERLDELYQCELTEEQRELVNQIWVTFQRLWILAPSAEPDHAPPLPKHLTDDELVAILSRVDWAQRGFVITRLQEILWLGIHRQLAAQGKG